MPNLDSSEEELAQDMAEALVSARLAEENLQLKYHNQVRQMLVLQATLVEVITNTAEMLGTKLPNGSLVKTTRKTEVYTPAELKAITISMECSIEALVREAINNKEMIKSLRLSVEDRNDKIKSLNDRHREEMDSLQAVFDVEKQKLTETNRIRLQDLQAYIEPESVMYYLVLPSEDERVTPVRYLKIKDDETAGITKYFDHAQPFLSLKEARIYRKRLLRKLREGEANFTGGIERAEQLVPARRVLHVEPLSSASVKIEAPIEPVGIVPVIGEIEQIKQIGKTMEIEQVRAIETLKEAEPIKAPKVFVIKGL